MFKYRVKRFLNTEEVLVKDKCRIICRIVKESKSKITIHDYPAAIAGCFLNKNVDMYISTSGRKTDYTATIDLEAALTSIGTIGEKINGNYLGFCAEPNAAHDLIVGMHCRLDKIQFTQVIRPRTLQVIKSCKNCKQTFNQL